MKKKFKEYYESLEGDKKGLKSEIKIGVANMDRQIRGLRNKLNNIFGVIEHLELLFEMLDECD